MAGFGDAVRGLLYREGAKSLPVTTCIIVFFTVMFFTMVTTVVFAFLPKMVTSYGVEELHVGYYAGIIGSSVYVGRSLCSLPWGYLADTKGKKFCSIASQVCLIVSTLAFGFSRDFTWATVTRLLQGCSMGQYIVANAILAGVSDESNMATGMAVAMTAYTVGFTLGPSVGGLLGFPADQYPNVFEKGGCFDKFGALLPILVLLVGVAIGLVITIILLPNDSKLDINEKTPLLSSQVNSASNSSNEVSPDAITRMPMTENLTTLEKLKQSKVIQLLRSKDCLISSLLYGLFSIIDIGFITVLPLLASTSRNYNGMQWDSAEIGSVLMIASVAVIPFQITILPKINTRFGCKRTLIASNLILVFLWPMLPTVALVQDQTALYLLVLVLVFIIRIIAFLSNLSTIILVNCSVHSDLRGTANGMALTVASLGRLLAPVVAGSLFSWSLSNVKGAKGNAHALGFPFDGFLTFFMFSLWSLCIAIFTAMLGDISGL